MDVHQLTKKVAKIMSLDLPNELETQLNNLVSDWTGCADCKLHKSRTYQVWWRIHGPQVVRKYSILICGEASGESEDLEGVPFVGRSGRLLDKLLVASDITHATITNAVMCRPPNNRNPSRGELKSCWPRLQRLIKILQPKVIVPVGKVPANWLLDKDITAGALVKRTYSWRLGSFRAKIVPLYHPAYLLRQNSTSLENDMVKRLRMVRGMI